MHCAACGNEEIPENSKFCNNCGTAVSLLASRETAASKAPRTAGNTRASTTTESEPEVLQSKAERVQLYLQKLLTNRDLPAFSHHINSLMTLIEDDKASLRRLTNTILDDHALTVTVMRTANSFHYNRSDKSIASVTHAVAMLGVEAVRHIAGSLLFLEHYRNKSVGITELLLLSTLTASHTRRLADRLLHGQLEEAHLCGMLRNLGEILISCYFPEDYMKILQNMKQRNREPREACFAILGFHYEDLGQAMARHWKLPECVSSSMAAFQPGSRESSPFNTIISFSHELTTAVYRGEPKTVNGNLAQLIKKYGNNLELDQAKVGELLDDGIRDTQNTFSILRIALDHLRLQRQTDLAMDRIKLHLAEAPGDEVSESTGNSRDLLRELEAEVRVTLARNSPGDLNPSILMILEAIFRGGPFDRVLLCLVTPDRREIRGRVGLGPGIEKASELFRAPMTDVAEPLVRSLLSRSDLFVTPEDLPRYRGSKLLKITEPACFGIFPISVEDIVIGGIYFDRTMPISISDPEVLNALARLRDLAAVAIARSRAARKPASANPVSAGHNLPPLPDSAD